MLRKVIIRKRLFFLLLIPISVALIAVSRYVDGFADWYVDAVYLPLSYLLNKLTSLVPFSVGEALIVLAIPVCLIWLIVFLIKLIRGKTVRKLVFLRFVLNILSVVGVFLMLFTLFAGINYERTPYSEANGLTTEKSTKEELLALCDYLAEELNEIRPTLAEDENGVMKLSHDLKTTAQNAAVYTNLAESENFKGQYGAPKAVFFSRLMSYTNTTGIYCPFTLEANVNVDVSHYSIPATMCHELSHLRGYMREDEAGFVSYLICRESGDNDFRYSGTMLAYIYANNALFGADSSLGNENFSTLSDEVKTDIYANAAYWKQFEGPVKEVAQKTNDVYLKANNQEDGRKSYGRMVDLLLADFKQNQN